jgi:hypothetical protein
MGSPRSLVFDQITPIVAPLTLLAFTTVTAVADPASPMMDDTQNHVFEAALLPQSDEALWAEELSLLTPLEEIAADTDLSQYMQKFVPAGIRREALRKGWVSKPKILNHRDPARDYAWDD